MTRGLALALAVMAAFSHPALAQGASESKPLHLTVRPSGYEEQNEALARQERLLRRLERSNHMVRSICTHCGDEWKHQIYAPFHPLAVLGDARRAAEDTAN
jgi:hypothetical protein